MFAVLPIIQQYVIVGIVALVATVAGLWIYNRREKRRKHALQLANLMRKWGMDWLADVYDNYAVGDYSGLTWQVKQIVTAVRSDEAMVRKLGDVAKKVAAYYAENDKAKAAELTEILVGTKKLP